jgi:UDP-N-acetylglucosamine 2-epimerase
VRIVTIVGARPQFIKAAPLSRALRREHSEILVHTGQHYDYEMSQVFFEGLDIPRPDHDLEVGSGPHGEQTAKMLTGIERILNKHQPDLVVVYGDTNSTLAGALAASKLHVPVAHVEAGLRSFNRSMPEEINRIVTDCIANVLLCPTHTSVENLTRENITRGVHLVGDVMFDVALEAGARAEASSDILQRLALQPRGYLLATVHRAGNTDDPANLRAIVEAMLEQGAPLVLPLHPRTRKCLDGIGLLASLADATHIHLTEPLGYLDFVMLQKNARKILTDSGGVQKEACFHKVPCVTLREETEWVETVESGWNVLVGADKTRILQAIAQDFSEPTAACRGVEMWDGRAAQRIAAVFEQL